MSFDPTLYVDAFWPSKGETDRTVVTDAVDLYHLGQIIDNDEIIDFDSMRLSSQYQLMGEFFFRNTKGNYKLTDIGANYKLINGLTFFGMLGQIAGNDGDVDRTLSHLDVDFALGEKPRWNLLTHSGNDKKQLFGCVMKEANITWERDKGYILAQTKYDALDVKTSAWDGDIYYPGTSRGASGEYKPYSIPKSLTWDSTDDGGADMGEFASPLTVNLQMQQKISTSPGVGDNVGKGEEIDDSLGVSVGFTLGYWGDSDSQIITDYKAGRVGTLTWQVAKPGIDKYFTVTATGCSIIQPMPFRKNGMPVAYSTLIRAGHLSVYVKDYLNDWFYDYPLTVGP